MQIHMSEPRYRLLKAGDIVKVGDEGLCGDAETWNAVEPQHFCVGIVFDPGFHMPMRRLNDASK
jgi:hypothetical protein